MCPNKKPTLEFYLLQWCFPPLATSPVASLGANLSSSPTTRQTAARLDQGKLLLDVLLEACPVTLVVLFFGVPLTTAAKLGCFLVKFCHTLPFVGGKSSNDHVLLVEELRHRGLRH